MVAAGAAPVALSGFDEATAMWQATGAFLLWGAAHALTTGVQSASTLREEWAEAGGYASTSGSMDLMTTMESSTSCME